MASSPRNILRLALASLLVISGCQTTASREETPDLQKLQGTWRVVAAHFDGEAADRGPGDLYIFAGSSLTKKLLLDGETLTLSKLRIDLRPDASPAEFDIVGQHDDDRTHCIYRFDGPRLVLCLEGNRVPPTAFRAEAGDDQLLLELERVANHDQQSPVEVPPPESADKPEQTAN